MCPLTAIVKTPLILHEACACDYNENPNSPARSRFGKYSFKVVIAQALWSTAIARRKRKECLSVRGRVK